MKENELVVYLFCLANNMKNIFKTDSQRQVILAIQDNDPIILKKIYRYNYPKIEIFILKNNGSKDQAKDIYQEAFLAVWQNVKQNKFRPQSETSINSYIYAIAKNKWLDVLRSQGYKKTIVTSRLKHFEIKAEEYNDIDDDILKDKRLEDVMHAFKNLGEACKSLLRKFYFEKKSLNLIAEELALNAASTRNKKYRCMQKLREIAFKN
ncbi:RNA polymerase sigma factor [Winogradskyella bathintestinalis]|uniref:Sigma-70 family RNA polymerase sigma factor n=1 Tax=Winogradskyella bathintestinalis TaxID=3035208 RepID=A0ABT7ZYJ8_9FLAO|nr:sigma-70 family RNA polymerase sigma factor [Winogradskyella bathintestinalis]MDN3494059.1 sigma-70 family RNA polymerase sigma factor [Winogradskyella bathintestinalis]